MQLLQLKLTLVKLETSAAPFPWTYLTYYDQRAMDQSGQCDKQKVFNYMQRCLHSLSALVKLQANLKHSESAVAHNCFLSLCVLLVESDLDKGSR